MRRARRQHVDAGQHHVGRVLVTGQAMGHRPDHGELIGPRRQPRQMLAKGDSRAFVAIGLNSPRISRGRSGFKSNVSRWLGRRSRKSTRPNQPSSSLAHPGVEAERGRPKATWLRCRASPSNRLAKAHGGSDRRRVDDWALAAASCRFLRATMDHAGLTAPLLCFRVPNVTRLLDIRQLEWRRASFRDVGGVIVCARPVDRTE